MPAKINWGIDGRCCSKCNEFKSWDCFTISASESSGHVSECKKCEKVRRDARKAEKSKYDQEFHAKHKKKRNRKTRLWHRKNVKRQNAYKVRRRKESVVERLKHACRKRLNNAIAGAYKVHSSIVLLGCTPAQLKAHLESKFTAGMSWANYGRNPGQWCVDHVIPCAKFDLTQLTQQRICFHHSNLQPMWFLENCAKGDRAA